MLPEPKLQKLSAKITIVRDDLVEGGSKMRFLPYLIESAKEVVFGGPFCGGAPLALSVIGKQTGKKITLFYAERASLHPRQVTAKANGANLRFVNPGYMTNVQAKARAYAAGAGALFLPLGFDVPEAENPFVAAMRLVRKRTGSPDQIWCAAGSGMLARCLSKAFPASEIHAVAVGLASRHDAQHFGPNVTMHATPYQFEQPMKEGSPFPSCPNYDRKAWAECWLRSRGSVLFWNVMA